MNKLKIYWRIDFKPWLAKKLRVLTCWVEGGHTLSHDPETKYCVYCHTDNIRP